ncbi:DUF1573 domain-containing protein [Williamwhitmania taraxaci]|uniref:DUF1573 domain-containing protein n=1 Tax=Williamwhitmania taraxaci TaxID=1640674 RepID=A0A1G6QK10_9BACT|nr:DUF1573 domain-containing protein [Williamwhitmania taraxaci]SDC92541.1 Protein of unknown function [Williamwhitmania taraxaci]
MMKTIVKQLSLAGLILFATAGFSQIQTPSMNFQSTEHDFGKIKEDAGAAIYTFVFVNKASSPIIIGNVSASCGCTTPEWTKAPIAPGKQGTIKVTFDPKNRPGPFDKTITINYNLDSKVAVLRIKGFVEEKEKRVEDLYPRAIGDLRLQSSYKAFIAITSNQVATDSLPIINAGSKSIAISFGSVPAHIKIQSVPETLKPNQRGKFVITYDAPKKNDWGFITDNFEVLVNGEKLPNNLLTVSANITEDFSKSTPQEMANAPVISFNESTFEFGSITEGTPVEHEFVFTNKGKTDLIIRKVKASCGCTTVNPDIKIVKPGQSSSIKASFRTDNYSGRQTKTITVISNDPKNANVSLRLTGSITPKQKQ